MQWEILNGLCHGVRMTVFQGRVQRKARHGVNVNSVDSVDV